MTGCRVTQIREPSILPLSVHRIGLLRNGSNLLDNVSFTLQQGPVTVVLGTNGAGKTLLLKICHGLLSPSTGSISWQQAGAGFVRNTQAMVFQRPVLLRRSVASNIDYALKLRGIGKDQRIDRIDQCLQQAGLAELRDRLAQALSGGEQQKLALARAWAVRPQVLFLDEPTANIDPMATASIERLIRTFAARGVKIVLTTHDLYQAKRLADEILFLHRGRLLQKTSAQQFFNHPATPEVAAFIRGDLVNDSPLQHPIERDYE